MNQLTVYTNAVTLRQALLNAQVDDARVEKVDRNTHDVVILPAREKQLTDELDAVGIQWEQKN